MCQRLLCFYLSGVNIFSEPVVHNGVRAVAAAHSHNAAVAIAFIVNKIDNFAISIETTTQKQASTTIIIIIITTTIITTTLTAPSSKHLDKR